MPRESFPSIREAVESQPLFDTHEHLVAEADQNSRQIDFLSSWLTQYASSDLVSAGLPPAELEEIRDVSRPLDERWARLAPYWTRVRTTGYGRALLLAARDLYGVEDIDDIDDRTWRTLAEKVRESNRPGWYRHVLHDRAGIEKIVVDPIMGWPAPDPQMPDETPDRVSCRDLLTYAFRLDFAILVSNRATITGLERSLGQSIQTLDDLVRIPETCLRGAMKSLPIAAVKYAVAYSRPLFFDNVTRHDAEVAFERVAARKEGSEPEPYSPTDPAWLEAKPLQDYLLHQTIRLAIEHGLPIQIHTGLQEGNGNLLANSRPTSLSSLFLQYPEARFDIFHAGYPYSGEVAVLAKNFPNVYADLAWVHVLSPTVGRRVLREWIETIPSNKIFAFGGDYLFVEGAYAHARLARACVARVLEEAVADGYPRESEALTLARLLLRDNAAAFFGIGPTGGKALAG